MRIKKIDLYHIAIPFSTVIQHNLKKRSTTASLVVRVTDEKGRTGFGEGAPRTYVTGNSVQSVLNKGKLLLKCCIGKTFHTVEEIQSIIDSIEKQEQYPALITAIEIALLDLIGQHQKASIGQMLAPNNAFTPVYSAVLPFLSTEKLKFWLTKVKQLKIKEIKVKVGQEEDEKTLDLVRKLLGDAISIRLDANRSWTYPEALIKIKRLESFGICGIEEPLIPEELKHLSNLANGINTPVILDESVYTLKHAAYYAKRIPSEQLIFNLKLSKLGGILATSKLHQYAQHQGIVCQLGCNVGETAILSSVGRQFAQSHQLKHLEGSYAPFFMKDDLGKDPMFFSEYGLGKNITDPGLGIDLNTEKLERYSISSYCLN